MHRWRRGRGEDGVIAIVVALVVCFVMVPLAAMAVDLGVQRIARRDMQSLADVVALDVARQLDGRTVAQLSPAIRPAVDRSVARNDSTIGATPDVSVELGLVDVAAYDPEAPLAYFTAITDPQVVPNAVRVSARTSVDFTIAGGSGGAAREAVAVSNASACFKVGSFALRLGSSNSALLNLLIGDALNVGALTYTGLAGANVSLLGLAAELGVATPAELASIDNLSLGRLYLALARVLATEQGDTANIALLNQLANLNLGALPPIDLGDLLALQDAPESALSTTVNVLDLVGASALLANGENALAVPNLTLGIPGIAGVTASLSVIQAPVMTCGPVGTKQRTSQVSLSVRIGVPGLDILGLVALGATVTVDVDLASGTATLTEIQCGGPGKPEGIAVDVASALAELQVGLAASLKTLGLPIVEISGGLGTSAPPTHSSIRITVPPNSYDQPVSSGSGVVLAGLELKDLQATVLGVLPLGTTVSGILNAVIDLVVAPVLNPVVNLVNTLVLGPVSDLLGLNVAGADVFAVPKPTCSNPVLAG